MISRLYTWGTILFIAAAMVLVVNLFNDLLTTVLLLMGG